MDLTLVVGMPRWRSELAPGVIEQIKGVLRQSCLDRVYPTPPTGEPDGPVVAADGPR